MSRLVAIGLTFFNQFLFYRTTISTAAPLLAHWLILPPSPSCTAMPQFASHNHMDDIPRTVVRIAPCGCGQMDRPCGDCGDRGGRHLGTYCFAHQQPDPAVACEVDGRRCPVPAVSWQGRPERSGSVYLGFGALLCGDRGRDPKCLGTTKTHAVAQQVDQDKLDSSAACRSAALTCAGSSNSFRTATRPGDGPRAASTIARPILVAT